MEDKSGVAVRKSGVLGRKGTVDCVPTSTGWLRALISTVDPLSVKCVRISVVGPPLTRTTLLTAVASLVSTTASPQTTLTIHVVLFINTSPLNQFPSFP
jgi:hypothetical protein